MRDESTIRRRLRKGARSLLLTNVLLAILASSNLVPLLRPTAYIPPADPVSISEVQQKNAWERELRDKLIKIQDQVEIDRQKLATDKLDQSQLLRVIESLTSSADELETVLTRLEKLPSPKDPSKTVSFQAFKERVEQLEKFLTDIRKKLDKEKRRLADGTSDNKTDLYEPAKALAELILETLKFRDLFMLAEVKPRPVDIQGQKNARGSKFLHSNAT